MPWALACSLSALSVWALAAGRPGAAAGLHLAAAVASAGAVFLKLRDPRAAAATFCFFSASGCAPRCGKSTFRSTACVSAHALKVSVEKTSVSSC